MNLLETILNAQGGAAAREAGKAVGLSPDQAGSALSALIPALTSRLHANATQPGGLEALLGALTGGGHSRYVDDTAALGRPETVADGNAILGHILGSKDASRAVASQAAEQTGLSADVLKKLLPLAATMLMGSMSRQQSTPSSSLTSGGGGLLGMLTPMLDQNKDGSVVDDVMKTVGKMFGGR